MSLTSFTCFLLIATTSFLFSKIVSYSLPMIPINSPHLQIVPQSFTVQQRHQFLNNISLSRASMFAMERNISKTSIASPIWYKLSNFFITELSFGSSPHIFTPYVLLDTGSEITWIQCDGCKPCFEVKGEKIRVQVSKTYRYMNINDSRCQPKKDFRGWCGYKGDYGGSSTEGPMGMDAFIFIDNQLGKHVFFQNVSFGCGLININIVFGHNAGPQNIISGILGLSPGPSSFLNQLDSGIKGRLSYCLISWADTIASSGKSTMYFGDEAQIRVPNVQKILMNSNARRRYHLYFHGISVDGKRLPIDPSICALNDHHYNQGFFIDSGSPSSVLPTSVYQPLREAVVKYFEKYGWKNVQKHHYGYDLCYYSTPKVGQSFPSIVFHFAKDNQGGEIDWVMKYYNMFVKLGGVDGFCMVVLEMKGVGPCLFGAYQHANFRVLYDVKNSILNFAPERCQEYHKISIEGQVALGSST